MDLPTTPLLLSTFAVSVVVCYVLFRKRAARKTAPLPPGPRGWPVLGNLPQLGGKTHQTLHEMTLVYGPLLRLRFGSSNVVVAGSAAVAEQFLRVHDANFSCRPPNSGGEHMAYNYQDVVFAPYGPRWRAMRKVCAVNLFSGRALDDLRAVREREAALMVRSLVGQGSDALLVPLGKAVNVCTTNALSRAAVGRRVFAAAGNEGAREFKEIVLEVMQVGGVLNVGDFVPALRWLDPQGVVAKMKKLHRRFDDMMNGIIADRKAGVIMPAGEEGKDLLGLLLAMVHDERPLAGAEEDRITETDAKALILDGGVLYINNKKRKDYSPSTVCCSCLVDKHKNLFVAGTDTTSTIVEWSLSELIRHPDILRQAQDELDAVVGRGRLVSESDLPRLTFFNAVIKETFRLHPSTPLSLPRMAAEECEVAGYRIPKGSELLVNVWGIARDPALWPDPLVFRPARFLPGGSHANVDVKGGDFGLIPFGAGRRICAGLSWGLRMVTLTSATLVHAFGLELPAGQSVDKLSMEEAFTLLLQRAVPLMVHLVPRLLPSAYEIA
ncbi:flavonoid 3'-monooxygenase CYP75B4-like isoform X1 [Panicum hallii]|uniref:flavonoid 3'-monooxygenase CYP75B4-like isoform X1 n=1 Tax=Panicum hallii TaxID=206008 RepID=UPI000DF4EB8C|nr:flavonoid 3'-monooxygenase CYP75B4-like isoform X1 [Panicum hallii]